ncbi:four helix bundle protein [Tenacibaculum sp. IB213877]|uniref:four helix bundle protein n=1 Tax=Tenacibaculum sp. IB213877 TaxID=3097351 RepID=UPI002A5B0058|nr:four helix bundle protein [Tenacibaculum sp. IB213877]MDY0779843.1 four helix bundle protein [Tenacibaculum sp. IB213877]
MKEQLLHRTRIFAHKGVDVALQLPNTYLGNHIKAQLVRASTSVGSNYRAACLGQSKRAFVAKLSIVIEEVDECVFWIQYAIDRNLLLDSESKNTLKEAKELTSIFVASRKTISTQLNNK